MLVLERVFLFAARLNRILVRLRFVADAIAPVVSGPAIAFANQSRGAGGAEESQVAIGVARFAAVRIVKAVVSEMRVCLEQPAGDGFKMPLQVARSTERPGDNELVPPGVGSSSSVTPIVSNPCFQKWPHR